MAVHTNPHAPPSAGKKAGQQHAKVLGKPSRERLLGGIKDMMEGGGRHRSRWLDGDERPHGAGDAADRGGQHLRTGVGVGWRGRMGFVE
jgi:hypothetical protein